MQTKPETKIVLPPIPAKRYFTIGEVSELCGVKPHVLRYWEQEFTQLRPMKRRGNRRYYQHHEVLLVRRIRDLLYEQGFTISGARNRLGEMGLNGRGRLAAALDESGQAMPGDELAADALAAQPRNLRCRQTDRLTDGTPLYRCLITKRNSKDPLADIPDSDRDDLALVLVRTGLLLASCDAPRSYADAEDDARGSKQYLWSRVNVPEYKRRCSR